jgi:lysophospholipase L1-like esterase
MRLILALTLMMLETIAFGTQKLTMAAVGDSITRGFNSGAAMAQPQRSWSLGWEDGPVLSHRQRLEALGLRVSAVDVSRSGATSRDLAGQIARLMKFKQLDYVTFLIGANDVCDWSDEHGESLQKFEDRLRNAMSRLVTHSPEVKILLVAIPDMLNLWEVASSQRCQAKWSVTQFCPRLLGRRVTDLGRQNFADRLADANHVLGLVANEFPENVKFVHRAASLEFEWRHISRLDCFHPSAEGQAYIAEETWRDGWFE